MIPLNRSFYYELILFNSFIFILFSSIPVNASDNLGSCGDDHFNAYKHISDIQGSFLESSDIKSFDSPFLGQWVVVEGIVTMNKIKKYNGFWLQQEAQKFSTSRASSGIFVYDKKAKVKRGQRLRLLARVAEYHGLTELKSVKTIKVCGNNQSIPKAASLTLPVKSLVELEALEGMRVNINQPLVVSDLFGGGYGFGNNGQFAISSRLHIQPTELYTAHSIQSQEIKLVDKKLDYILVDDGSAIRFPKFIPFPNSKGFSANNPLRISDRVTNVSAIVHSFGEHYILIPETKEGKLDIYIDSVSRPLRPKISQDANVVVASMNLENYFNGHPSSFNDRDVGFPTSRGAHSYSGFLMQTQKVVSALSAINADVIALMELENDGYHEHSSIADLTRALNKNFNPSAQYKYIVPKRKALGKDEISVGILYRHNKVKPLGAVLILDSATSIKHINSKGKSKALFNDGYNRPGLLQKFSSNGQSFYVSVNHFKSKGRPCRTEIEDVLQGHCNKERTNAAVALADFVNKQVGDKMPTLIMGDFNSYSQEEPLLELAKAGFQNLNNVALMGSVDKPFFSYSYQGYLGNLDHILANNTMLPFVRSLDSWHINSVEDSLLDYHTENNGQSHPSVDLYAEPDAYRSSDHDPLVIGIEF